jgi:pilus assembly protein Flp/PilA
VFKGITIYFRQGKGMTMLNAIRQFVKEEDGASAVEYAILLGIMGAAVAALVIPLGAAVGVSLTNATTSITASQAS